jgi:hypothetical protein
MKPLRMLASLLVLLCAVSAAAVAAEHRFPELNIAVTTDDSWSVADAAVVKSLTHLTAPSAVVHARLKGVHATPKTIDSAILLIYSKLPFGTPGDNPNVILAKEKAWTDGFEKSGAGYIELMQERVRLVRAPTKFMGEPKPVKIGDIEFHQIDAVNAKLPEFETKQRYLCTFKDGYYVYFTLSYNDEGDADFAKMMQAVQSFRSLKPNKDVHSKSK